VAGGYMEQNCARWRQGGDTDPQGVPVASIFPPKLLILLVADAVPSNPSPQWRTLRTGKFWQKVRKTGRARR
jgi:hypothetical protein